MIDAERVKADADLLGLAERLTELKRKANTGGGEWKGACPFCMAGEDRFSVQPYARPWPRWMCRVCTPKGDTVIGFIARRDNLDPKKDFEEICRLAMEGAGVPTTNQQRPERPEQPAYSAPGEDWQQLARQVIADCEARLWQPEGLKALDWLRKRGLKDTTIKHFHLGYNPKGQKINGEYWIDRGVVIPCEAAGRIWYVKVRRAEGDPKYRCMTGSKPAAIFNADALRFTDMALFVEGEFDAMIGWQDARDLVPFATLGSSTNRPDLATWGGYLVPLKVAMVSYDLDAAGQEGADKLSEILGDRCRLAPLPAGLWKDVNDYYQAVGNLAAWLQPYLDFYDPVTGIQNQPVTYEV